MKRQYIITIMISTVMLCAYTVEAKDYKGEIKVVPTEFAQHGDVLTVGMNVTLDNVNMANKRGVDIIPMIVSNGNSKTLPKISIKSANNYRAYQRNLSLMSDSEKKNYIAPYKIVKAAKNTSETINYKYEIPYELWMSNARLEIQRDDCGCGNVDAGPAEILVSNVLTEGGAKEVIYVVPYTVRPSLSFISPETENIKRRDVQIESSLDFAVNKTDIVPNYMNNPIELSKIRNMIDNIKSDKDVSIESINIIGYASPEGSLNYNKRLSEGRATALKNYLTARYDFPAALYTIEFGGENWDGLVNEVEASGMQYKSEVLDIINNVSINDGREKKLMDLHGGAPYKYMLREMFPALRVAVCRVNYNVRAFDVNEAKELINTRPQNLSLNEMYLVANTYDKNSEEFSDIFETAARMFPNDETAVINAASAALNRGDIITAEKYLNKIKSRVRIPEYDNAMGVLEMLKGNYDKAETYFKVAQQAGLSAATTNLSELNKKRENVALIKEHTK